MTTNLDEFVRASHMDDAQILSFVVWSSIAGALMLVTGFAYRAYSGRLGKQR